MFDSAAAQKTSGNPKKIGRFKARLSAFVCLPSLMGNEVAPICREHRKPKAWLPTTFEYSEDDITIRIPGVYAWVCTEDGEASFTPATVDELLLTVRDLLESAERAKGRRSALTEYIISVG